MPQTIQFDLQVDPTQVQSAITRVHQGVATGAHIGQMHAGGAMQGLSQMFGIGGGAGGARQIPTQIAPMNAVSVKQNNAILPFQVASHNISGMMARATAVSAQISQQAMIKHADALLPPQGNFRRVEAVKSGVGMLEQMGNFGVGAKIGSFFGPVGTIAGGLITSAGIPLVKKLTGVQAKQDRFFEEAFNDGKPLSRPGTPEFAKQIQRKRAAFELGTTFMSYGGYDMGRVGSRDKSILSGRMFEGITNRMKGSYGSEIKEYMTYLTATGNKEFRGLTSEFLKPGFHLTKGDPMIGKLSALFGKVKQKSHMMQLTPTQMAEADHVSKAMFMLGTGAKGPSTWSRMGTSFGQQMGLGKKWGKSAIYAMKGRARTDLGLTSEEKKMIGGSYGAASMMASSMGQSYSAGGLGYTQLAAWKGGAGTDVGILDIGGYAAKATSTVGGYVDFVSGRRQQMKDMGGEAQYAQHRSHYMQMIQQARENYPDLRDKSNMDILTTMFVGEGMPDLKANAKAAMVLGVGERFTGGGSGLHRLSALHTRTKLAAPLARLLSSKVGSHVSEKEVKFFGNQKIWGSNTHRALRKFTGEGWHQSGVNVGKMSKIAKSSWQKAKAMGGTSAEKSARFIGIFSKSARGKFAGMTQTMIKGAARGIIGSEMARGEEGAFTGGFDTRMHSSASYRRIGTSVMASAMDSASVSRFKAYRKIYHATSKAPETARRSMQRILRFQKKYKTGKDFVSIRDAALNMNDSRTAADAEMYIAGGLKWQDTAQVRRDAATANKTRSKVADDDFGDDISDTRKLVQGVQNIMKIVDRKLTRQQKALTRRSR